MLGPLRVHELMGPGPARGRLDVARARGFTRFVGRERRAAHARARPASGRSPGTDWCSGSSARPGSARAGSATSSLDAGAWRGRRSCTSRPSPTPGSCPCCRSLQLLRAYFGIGDRDAEPVARDRDRRPAAPRSTRASRRTCRCSSTSSRCPTPSGLLPRMDPDARQRRLLALMRRLIARREPPRAGRHPGRGPALARPGQRGVPGHQVEAVAGTRSLLVVNFRPEYHAAWMSRSVLPPDRARPARRRTAIDELLDDLLGARPVAGRPAPSSIRERTRRQPVLRRGARAVAGRGRAASRASAAPTGSSARSSTPRCRPRVQAVLAARIDRLEPRDEDRAAGGRRDRQASSPQRVLERVVGARAGRAGGRARPPRRRRSSCYERAPDPEALYAFKHPLTQEVAYRSQLRERRARRPRRGRPRGRRGRTRSASTSAPGCWPGTGRRPGRSSRRRGGTRARPCGPGRGDPAQALRALAPGPRSRRRAARGAGERGAAA